MVLLLCCPNRWSVLVACLIVSLMAIVGQGDAQAAAETQASQRKIDRLVQQLGSESFQKREIATAHLIAYGPAALSTVRAASEANDAEVRLRSKKILHEIERRLQTVRRRAFLAGDIDSLQSNLVSWQRMEKLLGNSRQAREMFLLMQTDAAEMLDDAENNPARCAARVGRLYLAAARMRQTGKSLPAGMIVAMVFVCSDQTVNLDLASTTRAVQMLYQFRDQFTAQDETFRTLLTHWIKGQGDGPLVFQFLRLALHYNLTDESLRLARAALSNPSAPYKAQAMLVLGQLGDKDDIERMDKLVFSDQKVSGGRRVGAKQRECRVGDVALAMAVALSGQKFKDYGFEGVKEGVANNSYNYYGFVDHGDRQAARNKWARYRVRTKP
jgi:hypothetical protein